MLTNTTINLAYLDLMSDGDDDLKKMMLEMLFDEPSTEIAEMRTLAAAADWKALKAVSHKLKSTFSYVGNDDLTATNQRIEKAAIEEKNLDEVPTLIERVATIWDGVLPKLKETAAAL